MSAPKQFWIHGSGYPDLNATPTEYIKPFSECIHVIEFSAFLSEQEKYVEAMHKWAEESFAFQKLVAKNIKLSEALKNILEHPDDNSIIEDAELALKENQCGPTEEEVNEVKNWLKKYSSTTQGE